MSKRPKQVDLAEQLRTAFEASGMTRFVLSKRSGVPYSGIHRFIAGDRDITLDTASRIAEVLGMELRPVRTMRR